MPLTDQVSAAIAALEPKLTEMHVVSTELGRRIPGWSGVYHYLFFKAVLAALPDLRTVLMLGVYRGRDIAFLLDAARFRPLQVVGVDKFTDTPCADWPEAKRDLSWAGAGFGLPPDAKAALDHISPQLPHVVRLIEADDAVWLESIEGRWDLIYVDTDHTQATCQRQLAQIRKLCHANTLIAGDDYTPLQPTWGVEAAVKEAFKSHQVLAGTIWFAGAEDYQ
jgi:hypothetical protein